MRYCFPPARTACGLLLCYATHLILPAHVGRFFCGSGFVCFRRIPHVIPLPTCTRTCTPATGLSVLHATTPQHCHLLGSAVLIACHFLPNTTTRGFPTAVLNIPADVYHHPLLPPTLLPPFADTPVPPAAIHRSYLFGRSGFWFQVCVLPHIMLCCAPFCCCVHCPLPLPLLLYCHQFCTVQLRRHYRLPFLHTVPPVPSRFTTLIIPILGTLPATRHTQGLFCLPVFLCVVSDWYVLLLVPTFCSVFFPQPPFKYTPPFRPSVSTHWEDCAWVT